MNESIDSSNTLEQICRETLTRFRAVWGAGDVDAVLGPMSDEPTDKGSTSPEPVTCLSTKAHHREGCLPQNVPLIGSMPG